MLTSELANVWITSDGKKFLSEKEAKKKFKMLVNMGIEKFLKKPIKSKVAKDWLRKQKKFQKVFKDPGQSRFFESIKVPVEIGDTILMGRFKNKKVVVKSIDYWEELKIQELESLNKNIKEKIEWLEKLQQNLQ